MSPHYWREWCPSAVATNGSSARKGMPCARCGNWAHNFRWCSIWQPEETQRAQFRKLMEDPARPGLFCFRRCRPTCLGNQTLASAWQLEARLADHWAPRREVQNLRSAVWASCVELDAAWSDLDR